MIKTIVIVTDTSMQSPTGHPILEQFVFQEHELVLAIRHYQAMVGKYKDDLRPGEVTVQMVTRYVSLEEDL